MVCFYYRTGLAISWNQSSNLFGLLLVLSHFPRREHIPFFCFWPPGQWWHWHCLDLNSLLSLIEQTLFSCIAQKTWIMIFFSFCSGKAYRFRKQVLKHKATIVQLQMSWLLNWSTDFVNADVIPEPNGFIETWMLKQAKTFLTHLSYTPKESLCSMPVSTEPGFQSGKLWHTKRP